MPQKIKIYTNESVNVFIVSGLSWHGIEAFSARDVGNLGLTDEEQLRYAAKENAVIFTHDDDFLRISMNSKISHCGIIFVHQQKYTLGECIRRLKAVCELRRAEELKEQIIFL